MTDSSSSDSTNMRLPGVALAAAAIAATYESALRHELEVNGFDICHPFCPEWYNEVLVSEGLDKKLSPLPTDGDAFLIGNTKALWPKFIHWLRSKQQEQEQSADHENDKQLFQIPENPLDTYTRESIETILGQVVQNEHKKHHPSFEIFWSDTNSLSRLVSMQRVASVSGFAYTDPLSKLSIHPVYGAWTSYRAVVVFHNMGQESTCCSGKEGIDSPPTPPPPMMSCLLSEQEQASAKIAMEKACYASEERGFTTCCKQLHGGEAMLKDELYKDWIALRDCVHVGKEQYRFSESQLLYHYTKDLKFLEQELG
eukprot:scaffold2848_cov54-Attheya_sp.AAC.1